jgi:hypothetical protein
MPEKSAERDEGSRCPRCDRPYDPDDLFCRQCGLEVRGDAGAIEAYLSKITPLRVDAILKDRFRDQKVVEVETAELLADRAMKWMKTIGYFAGIPLLFAGAILSFFGYKTYSDFAKISEQTVALEKQVEIAASQFTKIAEQTAALEKQVEPAANQIRADQERITSLTNSLNDAEGEVKQQLTRLASSQTQLQEDVTKIKKQLLNIHNSSSISASVRDSIESDVEKYNAFLRNIGFPDANSSVTVCIYPTKVSSNKSNNECSFATASDTINSFFMPDTNEIYIHEDLVTFPSIFLSEYTHYALGLSKSATTFRSSEFEVEYGVRDYFVASFLNDPLIGEGSGKIFGLPTSYIRKLDRDIQYKTVANEEHARGEVWSAALWACRSQLPSGVMNKIVYRAWQKYFASHPNAGEFRRDLLDAEKSYVEAPDKRCLDREMSSRGLPG